MYNDLKSLIREAITRPRILKPQTERHLYSAFETAEQEFQDFLDSVAEKFEEYEIEIIFGPIFTPSLEEQSEFSEELCSYQPDPADVKLLTVELSQENLSTQIVLSKKEKPKLPLHEVMIDRFVRLLDLSGAPNSETAARIRAALEPDIWKAGLALSRQEVWSGTERQAWLAGFLEHRKQKRPWTLDEMELLGGLTTSHRALNGETLLPAAHAAVKSARAAVTNVSAGRHYLSSDVAEHHSYKGSGVVNQELVTREQRELALLEGLAQDLENYVGTPVA